MPRVEFLVNASCPAGKFGEGATVELDDATALDFERQGAVKILPSPAAAAEPAPVAASLAPVPAVAPAAPAAEPPVQNVQVSASDGVQQQSSIG